MQNTGPLLPATSNHAPLQAKPRIVHSTDAPARPKPLLRKFEVSYLAANGDVMDLSRLAPARDVFEDAFSAFARGCLLSTPNGATAIEDLWPGDMVNTVGHGPLPLLWKGTMMVVPDAPGQDEDMGRLTRLPTDSFGLGRPSPDLLLGPRARILHRAADLTAMIGTDAALVHARSFVDGMNVIEVTPPSPVPVFHLGFARHCMVIANGMEVESYHPGGQLGSVLSGDMLGLYLSLFPHVKRLGDFGPLAYPRLTFDELNSLRSA